MRSIKIDNAIELPHHVAIIMDGNGRWAKKRSLPRQAGHEQGSKTAEDIVRYASEIGIKYITLYAFSSENWARPQEEVDAVMNILERYVKNDANELVKNDIRLGIIGGVTKLPLKLNTTIKKAVEKTLHCKKFFITLALSYGSWEEIVFAFKKSMREVLEKKVSIDDIDEKFIRNRLYTNELPDPDLYIRTGGEIRLSNFLLMQISYTELYFCKTLWPDFRRSDLDLALKSYSARHRRFGSISPH